MSEQTKVRMVAVCNFIRAGKQYVQGHEYEIPAAEAKSLDGWLMAIVEPAAKEGAPKPSEEK